LITLVEKWGEHGEPSAAARVAQARALIDLRQLDRAWVRLKDLVEQDLPDLAGVCIAAEMFLLRGWPNQARKVLQRGMTVDPTDSSLQALWDRATEPPTEPSVLDEDDATIDQLVQQAEDFLSHGSLVRAQGLLERVKREVPEHARTLDLLWGMQGDYANREPRTLGQLVDEVLPDLGAFADLSDDPEHTESANLADLPLQIDRDDQDGFPLLFRNLEPHTQAYGGAAEPEVTAVTSMAELEQGGGTTTDVETTASEEPTPIGGSDTQIMRVVHREKGPQRISGADSAHLERPNIDGSFDLATFRREMGMNHAATVDTDYTAGPEDEDDSVIILTRREEDTADGPDNTTDVGEGGDAPIHLDTETEAVASRVQGAIEDDAWARPDTDEVDPDATVPRAPKPRQDTRPGAKRPAKAPRSVPRSPPQVPSTGSDSQVFSWPWWFAALGALLIMGAMTFGVIALIAAMQ
jgi:hypothetical protein